MKFAKRSLCQADMGYAVATLRILGEDRVLAASESTGPAVVFEGENLEPRVISDQPGGSMGSTNVPGRDDALFMITRFYPIFKAEKAGIDLCIARNGLDSPWESKRIIELPFVHRIASAQTDAGSFLIAATVCGGKAFQDDWSKPGTVYVIDVPESLDGPWNPEPILEGIHKNHGMTIGTYEGRQTLLIAAEEGVFAFPIPQRPGERWRYTQIIDHDVSELGLIDLDGDGVDELVTIEPFHGDTLGVYKKAGSEWEKVTSQPLAFGHGMSVGKVNGQPIVVAGNRAGTMNLVCYEVDSTNPIRLRESVVDPASGSAGTTIVATAAGDAIVSSNAEYSEYAIYTAGRD